MDFVQNERPELYPYAEYKFVKAGIYCLVNLIKMKAVDDDKKQKKSALKYIKQELKKKIGSISSNKLIPASFKIAVRALTIR